MKKEIIVCDRCGAENADTYPAFEGRQHDGHRNENTYFYVDLCQECAARVLALVLTSRPDGMTREHAWPQGTPAEYMAEVVDV